MTDAAGRAWYHRSIVPAAVCKHRPNRIGRRIDVDLSADVACKQAHGIGLHPLCEGAAAQGSGGGSSGEAGSCVPAAVLAAGEDHNGGTSAWRGSLTPAEALTCNES